MKREILFKGFHPNEKGKQVITLDGKDIRGDWVEGYYIKDTWFDETRYGILQDRTIPALTKDDWEIDQVLPETVGQYIGLKDKNGKMIFEGDIVKYIVEDREEESNGIISYAEEFSLYDLYTTNGYYYPLYKIIVTKVIGNIHDNPELLEAEE